MFVVVMMIGRRERGRLAGSNVGQWIGYINWVARARLLFPVLFLRRSLKIIRLNQLWGEERPTTFSDLLPSLSTDTSAFRFPFETENSFSAYNLSSSMSAAGVGSKRFSDGSTKPFGSDPSLRLFRYPFACFRKRSPRLSPALAKLSTTPSCSSQPLFACVAWYLRICASTSPRTIMQASNCSTVSQFIYARSGRPTGLPSDSLRDGASAILVMSYHKLGKRVIPRASL